MLKSDYWKRGDGMGHTSPMLRGQSCTHMMDSRVILSAGAFLAALAAGPPDALNAILSHRSIQSKLPREVETQSTTPCVHTLHTLFNYRHVFESLATICDTDRISEYRGTKEKSHLPLVCLSAALFSCFK